MRGAGQNLLKWFKEHNSFFITTMDILVVLVSVTSYICIYRTVRKSKNKLKVPVPKESLSSPTENISTNGSRCQRRRFKRKPMLLVPVLLIATYIFFQMLPKMVYFMALRTNLSAITPTMSLIEHSMSHFVDALIYIHAFL